MTKRMIKVVRVLLFYQYNDNKHIEFISILSEMTYQIREVFLIKIKPDKYQECTSIYIFF